MKIIIIDVAASSGGALTILYKYYKSAIVDLKNQYYFIVSTPKLEETDNVKVLYYPWVKKSWFHRLFFDLFVPKKLVHKYNIDELFSLQNILYPNIKVRQILYLHQSLPFFKKKYKMMENFKFWVYQNIIKKWIFKSVKMADQVIVQTKWMKDACVEAVGVDKSKIVQIPPTNNIVVKSYYKHKEGDKLVFFYPAGGQSYKNHIIIIKAIASLSEVYQNKIRVIFTIKKDENKLISNLYKKVQKESLPIDFIGHISQDEVYEYYSSSILIFASYLESFGLPLLEARLHKCPIIASNCSFSKEILLGYDKYDLFNPDEYKELREILKKFII